MSAEQDLEVYRIRISDYCDNHCQSEHKNITFECDSECPISILRKDIEFKGLYG